MSPIALILMYLLINCCNNSILPCSFFVSIISISSIRFAVWNVSEDISSNGIPLSEAFEITLEGGIRLFVRTIPAVSLSNAASLISWSVKLYTSSWGSRTPQFSEVKSFCPALLTKPRPRSVSIEF